MFDTVENEISRRHLFTLSSRKFLYIVTKFKINFLLNYLFLRLFIIRAHSVYHSEHIQKVLFASVSIELYPKL